MWDRCHISPKYLAIDNQSALVLGDGTNVGANTSQIASHVSGIILLTVALPIRYAKDNDCCDSPVARRKLNVIDNRSPSEIVANARRDLETFPYI